MLNEWNEFQDYTGVVNYTARNKQDTTYLGRFTVRLPWDSDLDYIFRSVQDLVNGLESNETGEINYMLLKSKGEMRFIPSAPGA